MRSVYRSRLYVPIIVLLLVVLATVWAILRSPGPPATLIVNARIIDGTGAPAFPGAVRIRHDRIMEVGDLEPAPRERVVDAGNNVLAPGFIDGHSHADGGLFREREALAVVSQGITTVVVGQDGGSNHPLERYFERLEETPPAVNVASFAGHGTLRRIAMGDDFRRTATGEEVSRMRELLLKEMHAGALGLSTGLEYDPGIYASTEEVIALARVAAEEGGRYISHIRSEDRYLWQAVDEVLRIGREARIPVQISHMKLAMRSLWGKTDRLLDTLRRARAEGIQVTADVYPYTYWQSTLTVLFPARDFDNRTSAEFAVNELAAAEDILITGFGPDSTYVGKSVAEVAALRGSDHAQTVMDLIAEAERARDEGGRGGIGVIARSMAEEDVRRLIAWEYSSISTDGGLRGFHPRNVGSFPRVLGRFVREEDLIGLEEAVRKMTGLPAASFGFEDRGLLVPGGMADLVLFDPDLIIDRATIEAPRRRSAGVLAVWVNGVLVFREGRATGRYPGRAIRRAN